MSRRLLLPLACALALVALPSVASAATPGVNVSYLDNTGNPYVRDPALYPGEPSDSAAAWRDIDASGAKTLRAFVTWNGIDGDALNRYAAFTQKARAHGLAVELVVTGGAGTMATPAAYARAISALATRLKGSVAGYEIWNEPDGPEFWKDGPQPADYVALLKPAYAAVKAADPKAKVIVGGLVANDFDFLGRLYDFGAKGSFDAVAVHTDTACNTTVPTFYYREPTGRIGRYAFTGYREVHRTMVAHGDSKPIWMSELGWSTTDARCPVADKPAGVSPEQQAEFLAKAYGCLADDPYVEQGLWFNLHDINSSPMAPFSQQYGLVSDAFKRKPAFAAFSHAGAARPIRCGGALDDSTPTVSFVRPRDGILYSRSVPVHIHADDDRGVKDINLYLDGRYIPLTPDIHGTSADLHKILRQAGTLAYGPHTLVARARDEARNWGTTRLTILRVGGGKYLTRIPARLKVAFSRVSKRHMTVSGAVRFGGGVQGDGQVEFRFQRLVKGHWKAKNVRRRTVHRPFRFTFPFSGNGRWRIKTRLVPAGPFQRVSLAARTVVVR